MNKVDKPEKREIVCLSNSDRFIYYRLLTEISATILLSVFFTCKDVEQGLAALVGGTAVWLPNLLFYLYIKKTEIIHCGGRLAWRFVLAELVKLALTAAFLVFWFFSQETTALPSGITWLFVFLLSTLASAVIFNKR